MGCFRIDLTSPLELVFYGLSLLQAYRAVQLAVGIQKDWSGFRQPPLTRRKMHLVESAAFLLAIPPSVLVHEYFHAIPIWQFGGRVVSCGYGFYWGYVQPDRFFPPTQDWIISMGGTVGSLLFAAVLFALLNWNKSRTLRYFGRQSLRMLLHFSLIYYPIFTALTFIGDWRIIYDFSATPVLSGATAVTHALILLLFWQANRRGWFEMVGHDSVEDAEAFAQLQEQRLLNPHDAKLTLQVVDAMRQGGASQKAMALLQQAIKQNPNVAGFYLQLALLQHGDKGNVPGTAVRNLEKALQLGLSDPRHQAMAYHLLGQHALDKGQGQAALDHLDKAIRAVDTWTETPINPLFRANLYHLRSLVQQRLHQPELARQDAQRAVELAHGAGNERAAAFYQQKLEMIENWNGRR
jgi:tetratricopeptide (TPR) repeat protein